MSPAVSRNSVAPAGGIGLCLALVTVLAANFATRAWISAPLLPQAWAGWGLFCLFGSISTVEIPLMVFGLKKLAASPNPFARRGTQIGVGVFVFFAAVYALPNLLLAAPSLRWLGIALGATAVVRFIAAVIFVPQFQNADNAD